MTEDSINDDFIPDMIVLESEKQLDRIRAIAREKRFGRRRVQIGDICIHCTDLAAFYITMKDIFLHKIYDVETKEKKPFVIDGGAHIGLFSLYIKRKYPDSNILAFEPDPEALSLFRDNIQENNLQGIKIIEGGLSDKNGTSLFSTGLSDGCTLFADDNQIEITTYRLSDYIDRNVQGIKLNIEGAEWNVVQDIEPKLRWVDQIFIEYHGFPETGQNLHRILDIFHRNGFRYLIHDYDHMTNPLTKPPFRLNGKTKFFLLIYAVNLHSLQS